MICADFLAGANRRWTASADSVAPSDVKQPYLFLMGKLPLHCRSEVTLNLSRRKRKPPEHNKVDVVFFNGTQNSLCAIRRVIRKIPQCSRWIFISIKNINFRTIGSGQNITSASMTLYDVTQSFVRRYSSRVTAQPMCDRYGQFCVLFVVMEYVSQTQYPPWSAVHHHEQEEEGKRAPN